MRLQIFQGKDDQWYARIRADNGRKLFISEGYTRKENAKNAFKDFPVSWGSVEEVEK